MSALSKTDVPSRTGGPRLSESQRGVLVSSMSDSSCGLTLGRSAAWVVRMRRDLAQEMPTADPVSSVVGAGVADPPPTPAAPAPSEGDVVRPAKSCSRSLSQPTRHLAAPEAADIEGALVAACRRRSFDRSQAFASGAGSRGVRILAGASLKARYGVASTTLAPLLSLSAPELSPSMLVRYGIGTDDLLAVVELMGEVEGQPAPTVPDLHPGAPPSFQPRERKQAKASAPKVVAARIVVSSPSRPTGAVRLKPVSPDVARWAGFFLASPIWSADEVAELFDVHPDALVDALGAAVAA